MTRGAILLAVSILCFVGHTSADEPIRGTWTDREGKTYYQFLIDNEFAFMTVRDAVHGVWQSGSQVCWAGENKSATGNLMIYVDTDQCCLLAQFLSGRLVLSQIWQKGYGPVAHQICSNRVLTRVPNRVPNPSKSTP